MPHEDARQHTHSTTCTLLPYMHTPRRSAQRANSQRASTYKLLGAAALQSNALASASGSQHSCSRSHRTGGLRAAAALAGGGGQAPVAAAAAAAASALGGSTSKTTVEM
eukprot:COSAG01_NODE_18157_length_1096_cov_3.808425_1_plen_108_part_10